MESTIRKLAGDEFLDFAYIAIQAFPANKENTPEYKQKLAANLRRIHEESGTIEFYGLFRDRKLLGGMRLHTFEMNLFGKIVPAGGVGLVAVDLLHKKEKVAKELIGHFIRYSREKGASMALLYPFRPDFYKKMGFGYGTKMNQYRIRPDSFPSNGSKEGLAVLGEADKEKIRECYNRYAKKTHGMILKNGFDMDALFKNPDNRVLGAFNGEELNGYIVYGFEQVDKQNFLRNNLVIREFIYETPDALTSIAKFLNSQSDQIERIVLNTQDDGLEYMLGDARNGSEYLIPSVFHETNRAGVGLMYKVIDFNKVIVDLEGRTFNNVTANFTMVVHDSFESGAPAKISFRIEDGKLLKGKAEDCEVEIEMDIADFSSLMAGSVDFGKLHRYGRLKLSRPEFAPLMEQAFRVNEKPFCTTPF
ncbi:GNAT family N-acetyltransferase [Neobacillus piezotolerans]|uniref:GNAT family N-acetyltransferase n=1 Tax=Neobacillus piezotolerans TaxID=2259171 RepID=A0A3D8GVZ1_9BACI|nr:GNAT family N-acetyltransferase [Neobacillus piezotolerans]RDU38331.1 GNAT family N-acetyltransferase [Neobacillus piezotolerans]